jgi:DNA-binding transcriptional LysR family regulator
LNFALTGALNMNFLDFAQDYYRLRQFYYIAKAGSLSGAGRMLGVSHTTLSESMKTLEHRLKTAVLVREGRGMKLTVDGERLYEFAKKLYEDGEAFLKEFQESDEELHGEVKIITTPAMGETVITRHLLPLLEEHSNLRIKIETKIEDIDVKGSEVAIRPYISNQIDIEQLLLRTFQIKLWASKEYLDRFGYPTLPEELDNHRVLSFEEYNHNKYSNTNWILHIGRHDEAPRKPYFQISSNEGLYQAALEGYGIVQLPEEVVKIKGNQLIEVLPNLDGPKVDMYFIYPKRYRKRKCLAAIYSYLYARLSAI